ncbi:sugar transferase [Nocardioides rubriscoriae]|uniref:sugar transferase n=1 Tax=Nocardioides rubriscoriae TaxID=642762 RepID=UPI001B87CD8D|nr:sugar transferase [Nocardioides rubriscoriae]
MGWLPVMVGALDLVLVVAVTGLAVVGRGQGFLFAEPADVTSTVGTTAPLIVLGWIATTSLLGGYKADVFGAGTDEYKRVLNAGLLTAGLVSVACYLGQYPLSRGFFVLLFGLGVPLLLLGRFMARRAVHAARVNGALQQRVLIAGSADHVDEVAAVLRRERWLGYQITGALTPTHDLSTETPSGIPVVGNADDVSAMRESDVVFFAGGSDTSARRMRQIVWELEQDDVQLVVAPSVSDTSSERIRVRPVGGLPLMHIDPPTWSDAARIGKRTFDIVGSLALLLLMAPLYLAATASILVRDRGPVIFRQTRVGRHGDEFTCLKFRTMVPDAEALLARLQAETGQIDGLFKMKDDPRITRSGQWLRRFSVDELPQLVNVLRGDMSLVGPRPPLPSEVASYGEDVARRLHVRPGLTGLWQVSGRSDLTWDEATRLDLYYVDNWSMLQDVAILARTLGAVVGSRGAY